MRTQVINNRRGLVHGQLPPLGKDLGGSLQLGKLITLLPGSNLVDSKELAEMRINIVFDSYFSTRIEPSLAPETDLETVGKFVLVQGIEVPDTFPLAKLTLKACEALIVETFSSMTLTEWLEGEGRPEVRRDIQKQLDKLAGQAPSAANAGR